VVLSRGEVVVEEGKLLAEPGRGEFIRCGPPARLAWPRTSPDPSLSGPASAW